jgi:hypothetical protein
MPSGLVLFSLLAKMLEKKPKGSSGFPGAIKFTQIAQAYLHRDLEHVPFSWKHQNDKEMLHIVLIKQWYFSSNGC